MYRKFLIAVVAGGITLAVLGGDLAAASVNIYIDKSSQLMTVDVNGIRQYSWKVSTGADGYNTPSGTFQPFRMERDHFSREWDDAPMPHSIFFTYQGHAIHGSIYTKRLGTAASHGCVRLSPENASTLFALVEREGMSTTTISISGDIGYSRGPVVERRSTRSLSRPAPFWLRKRSW